LTLAFARSAFLGLLISAGSLAVLAHGTFGVGSTFTGLLIAGPICALIVLGQWRGFVPNVCDALFAALACCVIASFALNGRPDDSKETYLLILTLAAYPAGRLSGGDFDVRGLVIVTGSVVVLSVMATLPALIEQWSDVHGKPLVFGRFDAAPAQFSMVLGLLILALISLNFSLRRALSIAVFISIPAAIFAASMVRFTMLAIVTALAVNIALSPSDQRRRAAIVLFAFLIAVTAGVAARSATTLKFLTHAASVLAPQQRGAVADSPARSGSQPSADMYKPATLACPQIDPDNSIAIRKQLYTDAIALLPRGGFFGLGLDGFFRSTCITGHQVHNALLQSLFLLLVAATPLRLWHIARRSPEVRFAISALAFAFTLSAAYGRLSRETPLFLLIGCAAALRGNFAKWQSSADPVSHGRHKAFTDKGESLA
jgi:hypothetical protein